MNSYFTRLSCRQRYKSVFTLATLPICNRTAIQATVTSVSLLSRSAIFTFSISPFFRSPSVASLQGLHKPFPVGIILENWFTPIPAVHHMVDRPWIFHSQFPGHHRRIRPNLKTSQS